MKWGENVGFDFSIPDDFMGSLLKMQDEEEFKTLACDMLNDAGKILKETMEHEIPKDTGDLAEHIKQEKAKKYKNGCYGVSVHPYGHSKSTESKGRKGKKYSLTNIGKAILLEYGTINMRPRPFLRNVKIKSEEKVVNRMQEVYNKKVKE